MQHKSEVEKIIKDLDEDVAEEEKLIEDCYDGLNDKKSSEEEDADLDYSQTHLDDFLRSQQSKQMMRGSNLQSN